MKVEAEVKELKPLIRDEIQIQLKNAKSHEFDDEKIRESVREILIENMEPKTTIQEFNVFLEIICDMIINSWYYLRPEVENETE